MAEQRTLAMLAGFEKHAKRTRRAEFLSQMEIVVPWRELCASIEPFYPKAGNGRPPVGLERMLRMYFVQQRFNLSDPAVEEALYDSVSLRHFVGIDLPPHGRRPVHWGPRTWAVSWCRTRRQCASSATCWSGAVWAHRRTPSSVPCSLRVPVQMTLYALEDNSALGCLHKGAGDSTRLVLPSLEMEEVRH